MNIKSAFEEVIDRCRRDDNIDERSWNHGVLRVQHHMLELLKELEAKPTGDSVVSE